MTIREHIAKRSRIAMAFAFGAWLLFAVFGVVGSQKFSSPLFAMAAFGVFGGAIVYILLFIKCPHCGFRFGQGGMSRAFRASGSQSINYCAHCGIKLDEEM